MWTRRRAVVVTPERSRTVTETSAVSRSGAPSAILASTEALPLASRVTSPEPTVPVREEASAGVNV